MSASGSSNTSMTSPSARVRAWRLPMSAWLVPLALAAACAPLFAGQFVLHLAVFTCLNVLIVNGLSVIDRSGQLSFGHSAFVAIGAYVSVLLTTKAGFGIGLSAGIALLATVLFSLCLGWVILRLKGVYFVLVTFAFAELLRLVLLDWQALTEGASGIAGIPPLEILGLSFDSRAKFYVLALVAACLSVALVFHMFRRPLGRAVDAVCENAALAESTGLSVLRLQLVAFVIGCAMAGVGGVLTARYVGFISPESFNTGVSVAYITMLVIGGRRSLWGPLVGALVLTPLPELFRGAVQTQHIFYGAALILILRFLPGGIVSLASGSAWRRSKEAP